MAKQITPPFGSSWEQHVADLRAELAQVRAELEKARTYADAIEREYGRIAVKTAKQLDELLAAVEEHEDAIADVIPSSQHWGGGDVPEPMPTDAELLATHDKAADRLYAVARMIRGDDVPYSDRELDRERDRRREDDEQRDLEYEKRKWDR